MAISRRVRVSLWVAAGILAGLGAVVGVLIVRFEPFARQYVISALKQHYRSDVSLGNLQISLFPTVHATGEDLVFRVDGNRNGPPLISIRRFQVEASFIGFFRSPKHIRKVTLEGLQIHIPPKQERSSSGKSSGAANIPFLLQEVVANGTILQTLPADPSKAPLTFDIRQLTMHSVGKGRPMTFHALLNNAKPPGLIHSDGEFGPWNQDEPGDTAVGGKYTFSNADLSVFKGINGTLASKGDYRGVLDRIEVHGTTEVPDFSLTLAGHPMPLHTEFQATVDGINGNTDLHPVDARLGDSVFQVSGSIERNALEQHKEVDLRASAKETDLQNFLDLAIKSQKPPMAGTIGFDTAVKIPPGETPVVERMQLTGSFNLQDVRFTSPDVQEKIASLSHHAQGEPKDKAVHDVDATLAGRFYLRNAVLSLPRLSFDVPGARVRLDGHYALKSGEINFEGTAKLHATVSQMTTGWKHILLEPLDPLFKREGAGTVLPIKISGTRGRPSFKLDIGNILTRQDEK